ncbi:unnamed protein product [Owenia fusiformis]|uniref:Cytochrome c oxidase subunit 4 n=1 Tax=Owenia fusiformis TaxID=6347 RepID=A0A8J1Y994_OWEFU|nr:unnamed protein product [Owenia fusiformis]
MAQNLVRLAAKRILSIPQRSISVTAIRKQDVALTQEERDRIYPRIGDRDVVGYGFNGTASYMDREEMPFPAIRFKENTDDVLALRELEKGDWSNMTIEEKKALYRSSYRLTFAEMFAPTGEWKAVFAAFMVCLGVTGWIVIFMKKFVYSPYPETITPEYQQKNLERMIAQRQGIVEGVASKWDYENNRWKK